MADLIFGLRRSRAPFDDISLLLFDVVKVIVVPVVIVNISSMSILYGTVCRAV